MSFDPAHAAEHLPQLAELARALASIAGTNTNIVEAAFVVRLRCDLETSVTFSRHHETLERIETLLAAALAEAREAVARGQTAAPIAGPPPGSTVQ
jgi:hypothetical protein